MLINMLTKLQKAMISLNKERCCFKYCAVTGKPLYSAVPKVTSAGRERICFFNKPSAIFKCEPVDRQEANAI